MSNIDSDDSVAKAIEAATAHSSSDDDEDDLEEEDAGEGNEAARSDDGMIETTSPSSQPNSSRKRRGGPKTTARRKSSSSKQQRITENKRVKVTRQNLFHVCTATQKMVLQPFGNNRNFFGQVISGSSANGWKIAFDEFPSEEKDVVVVRKKIKLVKNGEEEKEFDHETHFDGSTMRKRKDDPTKASIKAFVEQDDDNLRTAKEFMLKWGDCDNDCLSWKILSDGEDVVDLPFEIPEKAEFRIGTDWNDKNDMPPLSQIFFDHFMPCIKGHGIILDNFYSDQRAPYYETVKHEKIRYHDADADDPDWLVKQCYLLVIAAASECENGITNLWKRGPSGGRRSYPDFGQYVALNTFKAFKNAAPFCWCESTYWYLDKRDRPWDIFSSRRSIVLRFVNFSMSTCL